MDSSTVQITRWKRYGKYRLYVTLADETKIGFWDLVTDEPHPEAPEHLTTLKAAVDAWKAGQGDGTEAAEPIPVVPVASTGPVMVPVPAVQPEPVTAVAPVSIDEALAIPWQDLSMNNPGAEPREQAIAAREAAPVKTLLARALRVHTDERAWRIGADAEELVAGQLAKTAKKDPRWQFIHSVPVGNRGSDIDHLIIGPGGIFTVNTKHHPKAKIWVGGNTFLVNGHKTPYIRNSRHEATRAAKFLTAACGFPVHVEGLIVTVNATDVTIKGAPDGVHVTWRNDLTKWLLRHGDILTTETVQAVYDMARRSTTWRT